MDSYRSGPRATALGIFTRVTADNPAMSDAWLGRLACGDQELDTLVSAHGNSRALYRETRRIRSPRPAELRRDRGTTIPDASGVVQAVGSGVRLSAHPRRTVRP